MRCNARLRHDVHGLGTHLKLDAGAERPYERGVQRLVTIDLGDGNVVLEFARQRFVQLMQNTQCGIAACDTTYDDAKAIDVGHLGERQMLLIHLAIDGIQGFFASVDVHLHGCLAEGGVHLGLNAFDDITPAPARARQGFGQGRITPGVQVLKGQVLQLAVGRVQTQAVGNGRVDVQGFAGNTGPFASGDITQRTHVVAAVREFDENDADVAGHGQQHFAEGLCLILFAGIELQLFQLGEAIHQLGHRGAKTLNQFRFGDAAILDGIVQ